MSETVSITIDGELVKVPSGMPLGAILHARNPAFRTSPSGARRGLYCGMGVCFECQVAVDGALVRACLLPIADGMRIETGQS